VIVKGDCIQRLKELPSKSVDLIITSPPYGLDKEYEEKTTKADYHQFAKMWTEHLPRVLKRTGQLWLNVGFAFGNYPLTYIYQRYIDLLFWQEIVWQFPTGQTSKKKFSPRTERWMWYTKHMEYTFNLDDIRIPSEYGNDPRYNPAGKNPSDAWYFDHVTSTGPCKAEKTAHPCQFPQAMIQRIMAACSNPGDMVLDPFAGSGTVGVVAKILDRKFLGFERDPAYCSIARRRIAAANVLTLLE